jgi:hypothetical protein
VLLRRLPVAARRPGGRAEVVEGMQFELTSCWTGPRHRRGASVGPWGERVRDPPKRRYCDDPVFVSRSRWIAPPIYRSTPQDRLGALGR